MKKRTHMAVEPKRGCGWRKIGGIYLVGGGAAVPCDRLPIPLDICPCCGRGIKQARGWTWVDVGKLVQGPHCVGDSNLGDSVPCREAEFCPLCGNPESLGRAGLLWIGEQFYKTVGEFLAEGATLGFSRRISAVPRGFEAGKTWVLLAHPKAVVKPCEPCRKTGGVGVPIKKCGQCGGRVFLRLPGVFYLWCPSRIEKILPESARGSEEAAELEKRGIVPVFVPDGDPDHQGNA